VGTFLRHSVVQGIDNAFVGLFCSELIDRHTEEKLMYSPSDVERDSSYGNQYGARRQPDSVVSLPASFELAAGVSLLNFRHPANVVASFNHVQSFAVGVTCLVIGLLCIIFNIVNICFIDQIGWVVYITGNGFWTGCMVCCYQFAYFTCSGVFRILARGKGSSRRRHPGGGCGRWGSPQKIFQFFE